MDNKPPLIRTQCCAFSLVEVVMAVGVVAFALAALIGVLSAGLRTNQDALNRGSAIGTLGILANTLRSTQAETNGLVALASPYQISWQTGGALTSSSIFLSKQNEILPSSSQAEKHAAIAVSPPAITNGLTKAMIVVAWPGETAKIDWNADKPTVRDAQGHEIMLIYFKPR